MDDLHFGYITKMKIKPCFGGRVWLPGKSDWGEGRGGEGERRVGWGWFTFSTPVFWTSGMGEKLPSSFF
jgi:hypothetical protein